MGIENVPYEGTSRDLDSVPYPASWVDHLIQRIKHLPIPSWLFYTALFGVIEIVVYASRWIDGTATFGSFGAFFPYGLIGVYGVGNLAAIHYINEMASRSFDDFLPALDRGELETALLRYQLMTMPGRETWICAVVGFVLGLPVIFLSNLAKTIPHNNLSFAVVTLMSCLGFIITAELLYHTIHQLRAVSHIHSVATNIDVLNPAPLYAFSRLSSLTGVVFLLMLWFDLAFNPETLKNFGLIALNFVGLGLLAMASFVLPLAGMHGKLVREKQYLQWEVNQRLKNSMKHLFHQIDAAEFASLDPINDTISGLISTQDFISKIPTWPWSTQTFTFFVSALILPVIVFVIQKLLGVLLGIG